ncbi:MAG TPA: 3-oxoacyl-[acyl-carrier-protein] synthase III C-terminal domain-containing protein, partial [Cyclobacteriaceae bacterium]|nr:3-oxoacyl-[acyl-carrier-protein] synthase III C-terminal domain-containing protein [Cyclobacteriaceae bacterium]
GCAGGVAALVLGSQLALLGQNSTLVIQSDAARKATSRNSSINKIFGNGSFACLIRHDGSSRKMLHHKSVHYEGLSKIVNIRLGHDADEIIKKEYAEMIDDPRKHLGLTLDNAMAMKLVREAENFYLRFIEESTTPDVMILHQVNPQIISHLKQVFSKYKVEFIDVASKIGNCGSATVGIALASLNGNLAGKKILLCSFGTGGVISAGLWQN